MKDQQMYKKIKVKAINPIYAVGLSWLLYGMIFPLYRFTDLLIAACISVICYILAKRFLPEKIETVPLTEKGALDTRCVEIIGTGYAYVNELMKVSARVKDTELSRYVREIIDISRQMLDYTGKNPRLALELRSFIDYYFPTTLKLLAAHEDMREQTVKSKNVVGIMEKVNSVMGTIASAFRKQLDLMYAEKRLDIKTDIEVLKNVLAAEGLAAPGGEASL